MKVLLIILVITSQAFAALKLFEMQKWDNCPGKRQIDIFVEVNNTVPVPNKMFFSGHLDVLEKVTGPLEISFETNRCEHNMEKCEKFSAFKLPNICGLLKNGNGPFAGVIAAFTPKINGCPMLPGKYVTPKNSSIDVSNFAPLPVDGYTWLSTVKASSGEGKNKKLALCLLMETKISIFKKGKKS